MPTSRDAAAAERSLLQGFDVYDQAVDVVSAFEWLHTDTASVPDTVKHFERYPSMTGTDGKGATPDFTVLFHQGAALVGEIARFSLRDESVDGLCAQLLRYDALTGVPDGRGGTVGVDVDVVYFVEMELGYPALQRILVDRLADPGHPYKPSRPPMIVQYARTPERYVFQRLRDPGNGTLRDQGRSPSIGAFLDDQSLKIPPAHFTAVKAGRAFVNDTMDPLYLATHLWAKTLPTLFGRPTGQPITVTEKGLGQSLREQYGLGNRTDVHQALLLLDQAGLAAPTDAKGEWNVAWRKISTQRAGDLHRALASRAAGTSKAARAIPTRPGRGPAPEQLSLL